MGSERQPAGEEDDRNDDVEDLEASDSEGNAVEGGNSQFGKMKDVRK